VWGIDPSQNRPIDRYVTAARTRPRIVAIAGGKGGVGKSTIAVQLGLAIGRLGSTVALVDADLGAANLHTMVGVTRPSEGLAGFFDDEERTLDDVACAVPAGGANVRLVPGTARPGAANSTHQQRLRLTRALAKVSADVAIVDLGAGSSYTVVDLVCAADVKLFVLTPQLASIHNAYALIKACIHRVIRRLASDDTGRAMIDAALAHDHKARTVAQLCGVLRGIDEKLADRIETTLGSFHAGLVGNQLERPGDAAMIARISTLIGDQLGLHAPVMSGVARSRGLSGVDRGVFGSHRDDATFAALAKNVLGVERSAHESTMPMWLVRDLEAAV
jgi:flagellar biosynthesis protein FlhG